MKSKTVLAIDPGSSKCGMALVKKTENGKIELLWRSIVATSNICEGLKEAATHGPYDLVILGGGTHSSQVTREIRTTKPGVALLVVDERDTSLQARERYWLHINRKGWRRLLPSTLQVPPEPVDDFVALILAERVLQHM